MVKQKIMYLLCLLMFAVGINAQTTRDENGNFISYKKTYDTSHGDKLTLTGERKGDNIVWKIDYHLPVSSYVGIAVAVHSSISPTNNDHTKPNNVNSITSNGSPLTAMINAASKNYQWGTFSGDQTMQPHTFNRGDKLPYGSNSISFTTKADGTVKLMFRLAYNVENSTGAQPQYPENNPRGNKYFTQQILLDDSEWKNAVSAPTVERKEIAVYRGETYPATTITATDTNGVTRIFADSSPIGGSFTESTSGRNKTLTLSGAVPLDPTRNNPNDTVTSTHTITANDATGNASKGTLIVKIFPQKDAYEPTLKPVLTVDANTTVTPESLINSVPKVVNTSTLPSVATNPTYSWEEGYAISTTTAGRITGKVRVTYQDGSYDVKDVEVEVRQPAPTIELPVAVGSEFTVYRGEDYSLVNEGKPFVTVTHKDQLITGINPIGNIPPRTVAVPGTTDYPVRQVIGVNPGYLMGCAGTIVPIDPLKAPENTVSYRFTGRITVGGKYIYSNEATVIIHTKAQTEAYHAVGKEDLPVEQNSTVTPESMVASITKIASTLPNVPRNATYSWVGTPITTTTSGKKTGKVRITYEDTSFDEVDVSVIVSEAVCTKPANTTGTALNTIVGITDLGRAESNGNLNDDTSWPMMRKGGWLALESNDKGFVVTRMTTTQITAISAPQEGMIVYDTDAKCLKLYDGTKWSCFSQPVCPKF